MARRSSRGETDTEIPILPFLVKNFDVMHPVASSNFKDSYALADALAKACMLTPAAARKRLAARHLQLKYGSLDEQSGDYVPPKELLMYLVRMGSFSSTPKILNNDVLDQDVRLAKTISRQELLQLCQKQHEHYPLVKRTFRKTHESESNTFAHDLKAHKLSEVSKACSERTSNPSNLRILQWNVLSQALGQFNDNFVRCPEAALEWHSRRFRLIEEIIEYSPDIICLQEVDHFNFLKYVLGTQGYVGTFFPKPDSPCIYIDGNNGPDGCAIFYRKDKFELVKKESRILEIWRVQSNQVALLVVLKIAETGQEICVVTTHFKARKGALLATLRNEQGRDLLQFLSDHNEDRPIILCGDFNAEPTEPIYPTITNHSLRLSSAYAGSPAGSDKYPFEPPYTTWKVREEGEMCHTIDYVFYSKDKLDVDAVLGFPTGEEIGVDRVPSHMYPSDHFSLVCDFKLDSDQK